MLVMVLVNNLPMKRLLIDQKKLDQETASLLLTTYPDGFGDDDIISFKKPNGEIIQAVELRTDGILYLVKIGKNTTHFISEESMQEDDVAQDEQVTLPDSELELDMEEEAETGDNGE